MKDLRSIPSVERVLAHSQIQPIISEFGRSFTLQAVRSSLDDIRIDSTIDIPDIEQVILITQNKLQDWSAFTITPVVNATGVILHTNLGRAPLCRSAVQKMVEVSSGYCNLEFDLSNGVRGSRYVHVADPLIRLSGAEQAMVVNNNASAILLTLSALANRREVVIARSQLVEIGGGFRIPDVMRQSGAKLVEIGTTNQIHLDDYLNALEAGARVVMRVHSSNFKIIGYSSEPALPEIVKLAHQYGAIVIDDLGSGTLIDTVPFGLGHEPMIQESIQAGADVVCFSGDKLLGGPQAGIIIGKDILLQKIKKHPLARAVRADKLCLAGLAATLSHYLRDQALTEIPIWRMITCPLDDLKDRVDEWQKELGFGASQTGFSTVGGGSLPEELLPTWLLALPVDRPVHFMKQLREQTIPIIARIESHLVLLDPRTVLPEQDSYLIYTLQKLISRE